MAQFRRYNDYWAANGAPYLDFRIAATSRVADPRFVAPGSDFRPQRASPLPGAGSLDSVVAGFTRDMAGAAVPDPQGKVSIGAYVAAP